MRTSFLVASSLLALTACGGGGGGGGDDTNDESPAGLWLGDFTSDAGSTYPTIAIVHDGKIMAFAYQDGFAYEGGISVSGDSWNAELTGYNMGTASQFATGQAEGDIKAQDYIRGPYSASTGETGSLSLQFRDIYNRSAEVSKMTGTYSANISEVSYTVSLDASQSITGSSSSGCTLNGSYTIPDPNHNLYKVSATEDCPDYTANYSGYAFLEDDGGTENAVLTLALRDGQRYSLPIFYRQ